LLRKPILVTPADQCYPELAIELPLELMPAEKLRPGDRLDCVSGRASKSKVMARDADDLFGCMVTEISSYRVTSRESGSLETSEWSFKRCGNEEGPAIDVPAAVNWMSACCPSEPCHTQPLRRDQHTEFHATLHPACGWQVRLQRRGDNGKLCGKGETENRR
jgi:hypothetical protein